MQQTTAPVTTHVSGAASGEVPQPRRGGPNRITGPSGKPLLVIVEGTDIERMIDSGLDAIGGIGRVLAGAREVLLKPNTNQRDPFPSITAPEVLRIVADRAKSAGARRVTAHEDHKAEPDPYYNRNDLPSVQLRGSHAPTPDDYILVEHDGWVGDMEPLADPPENPRHSWAAGALGRGYRPTSGPMIRVAREVHQAEVVINLPVLKRHFAGQITSALKNHFGSVYGAHRWLAHTMLDHDRDYYDRKLAEFASAVRPELTITDIRSVQTVSGPGRRGDTVIVDGVDRLIVTGDMVAADTVAMEIMREHDTTFTDAHEAILRRQFAHAEALELGTSDLSKLEVIRVQT